MSADFVLGGFSVFAGAAILFATYVVIREIATNAASDLLNARHGGILALARQAAREEARKTVIGEFQTSECVSEEVEE